MMGGDGCGGDGGCGVLLVSAWQLWWCPVDHGLDQRPREPTTRARS